MSKAGKDAKAAPGAKSGVKLVKLQLPAGKANPAPPVGTALGPHGVNIMDFCKQFNARTQAMAGSIIPVVLTIDVKSRSFTFILKAPPASDLIKKEAKIEKGSKEPNKNKVAKLTTAQVKKLAELKLADLNSFDLPAAMKMIEGTARSMGVEIVGAGA